MVRRIVVGTASSSSTSKRQLPPLFFTVSGLINRAPLKAKYPKSRGILPSHIHSGYELGGWRWFHSWCPEVCNELCDTEWAILAKVHTLIIHLMSRA